MPIESQLLSPAPLVYSRFTGRITFDDFTTSSKTLHANPDFTPGMHMILDMLHLEVFDVGFDEMKTFTAGIQKRHRERGEHVHIFIVCSNEQSTWLAEMFRSLLELEGGIASVDIVQGFPDILAILDLPPETIDLFPEDCQTEAHLLNRLSS